MINFVVVDVEGHFERNASLPKRDAIHFPHIFLGGSAEEAKRRNHLNTLICVPFKLLQGIMRSRQPELLDVYSNEVHGFILGRGNNVHLSKSYHDRLDWVTA